MIYLALILTAGFLIHSILGTFGLVAIAFYAFGCLLVSLTTER